MGEASICLECNGRLERVEAVLQSLAGHAVYGCLDCGHVLLVAKSETRELTVSWLPFGSPQITCVSLA